MQVEDRDNINTNVNLTLQIRGFSVYFAFSTLPMTESFHRT